MINAKKKCNCGGPCCKDAARRGFSDPRFARARLGDPFTDTVFGLTATGSADTSDLDSLPLFSTPDNTTPNSILAASAGIPAPPSISLPSWLLPVGLGIGAFVLIDLIETGGGKRRR